MNNQSPIVNLVFDIFGAIGVTQCTHSLIVIVVGRTAIRTHDSLGVATERVWHR